MFSLDDLPCGGSLMIFNHSRDILQILTNFTRFFKHESCGLCTPCRAGNFLIERKLELFEAKLARERDVEEVHSWGEIMKLTCRCGLGKTAPNSLLAAQAKFPEYFEKIANHSPERLGKGFSLEDATHEYDRFSS